MKFIDEVEVLVQAGDGGRGCVSFLRERHRPRGGPDGGDGGKGGDVVFAADSSLTTLFDLTLQRRLRANRGQHGQGGGCNGAAGADLVVRVPTGTLVTAIETGEVIGDLVAAGMQLIVARGGRGGRGNRRFATPTQQAPRWAEPGRPGVVHRLRLELRVLADVGLVGLPNAGKSTLLAAVSAARPRVAAYPFTTLAPQLGVICHGEEDSFVMADIPGLVQGAHQGAGLGIRFLRHLSRTTLLVHLVDASCEAPEVGFATINAELASYDPALAAKPQVVVATKIDLEEARRRLPALRDAFRNRGVTLHAISALTGEGVAELVSLLCSRVPRQRGERLGAAGPGDQPHGREPAETRTPRHR